MGYSGAFATVRAFLRAEVANVRRFDVPWRRRLRLYRHGFLSSRDALWGLGDGSMAAYLSDRDLRKIKRITDPYGLGLADKLLFHMIVSRTHEQSVPALYGLLRDGRFVSPGPPGTIASLDDLVDRLADERVVVKPVRAAQGDGVCILQRRAGNLYVNNRPVDRDTLVGTIGGNRDHLLTEHVGQADYAARIFPEATNTLRLLTMIDPETDQPYIAAAAHRFGTATTAPIDTWAAGGVSAGVNLETGELGPAVRSPEHGTGTLRRFETHPDSGARISGVSVPRWEAIREAVRDLAAEYAWLWPHVGWDLVVRDDTGSIAVLEGDQQSVDADLQAHGPLLDDDRVRRFYEFHGIRPRSGIGQ